MPAGLALGEMDSAPQIHGTTAPGFELLRDVFAQNFSLRGERGSACAGFVGREKVVDLWGGVRDHCTAEPWEEDTLALVFSTTKGLAATAMAMAHSRGWIGLDDPVARYWPEFGQHGKERITVRDLLTHRAGLAVIDRRLSARDLADLDSLAVTLAAQRPAWPPGTRQGYHAVSLGFYLNELMRRIDPAGRTIGQFLREAVNSIFGPELFIGLPPDVPEQRLAMLGRVSLPAAALNLHRFPPAAVAAMLWPWSTVHRALLNPRLRQPRDLMGPALRKVEIPSANGLATARGLAALFGELATGGRRLGITPDTFEEMKRRSPAPSGGRRDVLVRMNLAYSSFGHFKPAAGIRFGTSGEAFGSPGAGGTFAFADPQTRVGYAYTTNRMGYYLFDDPREKSLRDAVMACIARR
jgi:CubicO group peptidase (beta-lactamase class C family)